MRFNFLLIGLSFAIILCIVSPINADVWISNPGLVDGLTDVGYRSSPTVYNDSGTLKLISGEDTGIFTGFEWNGTYWVSNNSIVTGLGDVGSLSTPAVYDDSGTLKLISGENAGVFTGFEWDGASWVSNSNIVTGLGDVGSLSCPTIYNDSGTWKLISGDLSGGFNGFEWDGASWVSNGNIVAGLGIGGYDSSPVVYDDSGTLKLISGENAGVFTGFEWDGASWVSNSNIVTGLTDVGYDSTPVVYGDSGKWKLISGKNDGLFTGFLFNTSPTPPSFISPSNNTYKLSNPSTIPVVLNASSTDLDGDPITYYYYADKVDGSTLLGTSNSSYNWYVYSSGVYYLRARAYDGFEFSNYSNTYVLTNVLPPYLTTNILKNSGFENWTSGPTSAPDNWTLGGGGVSVVRDSTHLYTGSYSVGVTYGSTPGFVWQSTVNTSYYLGKTLTVAAWIYADDSQQGSVVIDNGGGYNSFSDFHTGSGEWEWLTTTLRTSDSASYERVQIRTSKPDTAYFDGAALIEGLYPYITYPANGSTINASYPPFQHEINFIWQDTDAPQYRLQVATDENFNLLVVDTYTTNYYSAQYLNVGHEYYWRLYAYDGSTFSDVSDTFNFELSGSTTLTGSAVYGTIYSDSGYLSYAEIVISNSSDGVIESQLTGSNGYYQFTGLNPGVIYTLSTSRDLYLPATANFNASVDPQSKDFYLLADHTSEEWRHDVTFVVRSIFGTRYENVEVKAYENGNAAATFTGTTDSIGHVTFYMNKNVEYRMTFINSSQGISITKNIFPEGDEYWIIVSTVINDWNDYDTSPAKSITANVTINDVSTLQAFVNVTYNDTLGETTGLLIYLNQTNASDPLNQTVIDSWNGGASSNAFHSFELGEHSGESYIVHIVATHSTYGTVHRNYGVMFSMTGMYDGIPQWAWLYLGIFLMVITGGLALATAPEEGAIVVCSEGWIFYVLGWFNYIGTTAIALGLTVATVISVLAYLAKKDKEGE